MFVDIHGSKLVLSSMYVLCVCVYHGAELITLGPGATLGIGATLGREARKLCGIGGIAGWTRGGAGSGGIGICGDDCCGGGGGVTGRNTVGLVAYF